MNTKTLNEWNRMIIQEIVSKNKVLLQRGYSYVGIPGMGFVIASVLQKHLPWDISLWVLYPLGIFAVWLTGVVDVRYGFYSAEIKIGADKNPVMTEIRKAVRK